MSLDQTSLGAIDTYLEFAPPAFVNRGRRYFEQGRVLRVESLKPNQYSAAVQGSDLYDVELKFFKGRWTGACTCPMGFECKHVMATLFAVRNSALGGVQGSSSPKPRAVAQPPKSALYLKLVEKLSRKLNREEVEFVKIVQSCFAQMIRNSISEMNLIRMAGRGEYGWQTIEIAPKPPEDDYEFWLYAAWEMRARRWSIPDALEPITDFSLIEPAMKKWQRQKEIESWKTRLRDVAEQAPEIGGGPFELRLVIAPDQARLQWRDDGRAEFRDVRQADAKGFANRFEMGTLQVATESLPIWSALFDRWSYQSWWTFRYDDGQGRARLGRVLRLPIPPGCLVREDGVPLPRATEALRFEISEPADAEGNYELRLVRADGSEPPKPYCTFEGRPTLYLCDEGLFEGPGAGGLQGDLTSEIPAGALETAEGVRFLQTRGVPLPNRLKDRVRMTPVKVTIACGLTSPQYAIERENICVEIWAEAPGMMRERFICEGWLREKGSERQNARQEAEIVVHDRSAQDGVRRIVEALPLRWDYYTKTWQMRLTKKTPDLFVNWLNGLPSEMEVLLDKQLATLRDEPVSGAVSLDVAESGIDWFDLKVTLNVGDTTLTPEELKLLLNARGGYVRLGKKGWRRLKFDLTPEEDEHLARLGLSPRDFTGEPHRFHTLQLADDAAKRFLGPDRVAQIQQRVSEIKTRVTPALPEQICAQLRPYQTEGFHFLAYLATNRFGGVLADDMGLGKTVQALSWLAWLRSELRAAGPSLVVCPKSVMDNWRAESARFYPDLRVRMWRGETASELAVARQTSDLLVANYSQLRSLLPAITEASWLAVILDEAQYIKNPDSQTAQAARALKAEHRLALTGTPIENRLLDLWSIMAFAMPGALGNRSNFLKRFDAKDDPLARRRLAARVRPFLLRRAKKQVAKDLPDRVEEDLLCEMEGEQKSLYRAELKRARQLILRLKTNKQLNDERFNILTSLLRLRQICCHPALVDAKLRRTESAKMAALDDMLEPLIEEGHKVLVFSQFVTMLDILRENARARGWRHFYLAGETENRGELVQEFQTADSGAVFFISLKAGGFGLNLTAASYVVLFDPWWNPAVENQAIDRTHRIGQTSKVMAYRLLMRESIEEKIRALQKQKAGLAEDVLGEERFAQSLTLDDLKFLFAE